MAQGSLGGRVAVISGANRGIGFAIASLFGREGAQCVLVVRDRAAGEEAASKIEADGKKPIVAAADVSDRGAIASAVMEISERFPHIDLLVNNAGVLFDEDRTAPPSHMDPLIFERTFSVNVDGAIAMSQSFLPLMGEGGRIINVSSTMGQLTGGSQGYAPAYCMSKTALNAFNKSILPRVDQDAMKKVLAMPLFHLSDFQ